MEGTPEFLLFLGRFHPLLLHLPIGFLALGILLELYTRRPAGEKMKSALPFVWLLSAISAFAAALLGYLLSLEGGYQEELLDRHKWLGIALTAVTILLYLASRQRQKGSAALIWQMGYLPMLFVCAILLGATGHIGGSLTHGSDYLTQYAPDPLRSLAGLPPKKVITQIAREDLATARVFHDLVQPILDSRCVSCHNPEKKKGELLLDSPAGISQGGETGEIIIPGNADASNLYQRLLLPHDDEEHMPPSGKRPLEDDQIALLGWWIEAGAPMEENVRLGDTETASEIMAVVERLYVPQAQGVFALEVDMADADDLAALRAQGIKVHQIVQEQPWLEVNLSDQDSLPLQKLEALLPVREQLIELDLGNSALTEAHLELVGKLPHLTRLHLEETDVNDQSLKALGQLQYLEYLNLFGTSLTDAAMEALVPLKNLKTLYLWQTRVTEAGTQKLLASLPQLEIEQGLDPLAIFGSAALTPPLIEAEKTLFKDSISIVLRMDINGIAVHYTLDGSEPDSTSPRYSGPIVLHESQTLKAFASKAGWVSSPVVSQDFVKVSALSPNLSLQYKPSEKYAASGELSLVDLQKGSQTFSDGKWLGFEGRDLIATLDLKKSTSFRRVTISCLENVGAWIFYPVGLEVRVSQDGNNYRKVAELSFPATKETVPPSLNHFFATFDPVEARYVRIHTRNLTKVPDWHPGAGGKAWLFVDEVMVE